MVGSSIVLADNMAMLLSCLVNLGTFRLATPDMCKMGK